MTSEDTPIEEISVDEAWIADWAAVGIVALERLLGRHAAFAAFLATRPDPLESGDGDGTPDA